MDIANADSDSDEDFKRISEATHRKMTTKLEKLAYADGAADGSDEATEICSDLGFIDGFRTSFHVEKFKTFFNLLDNKQYKDNEKLADYMREKLIFESMQLSDSDSINHCQIASYAGCSTDVREISQLQREYINNFLKKCANQIPITTQLFERKDIKEDGNQVQEKTKSNSNKNP